MFVLVAAALFCVVPCRAQQPPPRAPDNNVQPPASSAGPAPQVQGYTLTPEKEARAIAYAHARHELYFLDVAYGLLLLVLMLQLRIAPKYRDWATAWTDS